jgi:GR25 family glycosyltransferase involved in LPS biosynthesis
MIRVVIVGGDQPRSDNLIQGLVGSGLFQVEIQRRIDESDLSYGDFLSSTSLNHYGRELSVSEKCCSLAHRLAQEKIKTSGGIILEDDAVVLDYEALARFTTALVASNRSILVNFSSTRCAEDISRSQRENRFIRTWGPTPLAVGYAASKSGILQLINSNTPLRYVADWPPINSKNYRLKYPIIAHGHKNTLSLIDSSSSRVQLSFKQLVLARRSNAVITRVKGKIRFEFMKFLLLVRGARP